MIIQHRFTVEAEAAAGRYLLFSEALRGIYLEVLNNKRFGSPQIIQTVGAEAQSLLRSYLDAERRLARNILEGIAKEAHTATLQSLAVPVARDLPDDVSALLSATLDYLIVELRLQGERDIALLVETVRRAALQFGLAARAGDPATLPIHTLASTLSFYFRDRRNYRVASHLFVRGVWRQSSLALYNETVLLTLADHGETLAQIEHIDSKASIDGLVVSMAGGDDHPIYDEIRLSTFHPNSNAILRRMEA